MSELFCINPADETVECPECEKHGPAYRCDTCGGLAEGDCRIRSDEPREIEVHEFPSGVQWRSTELGSMWTPGDLAAARKALSR